MVSMYAYIHEFQLLGYMPCVPVIKARTLGRKSRGAALYQGLEGSRRNGKLRSRPYSNADEGGLARLVCLAGTRHITCCPRFRALVFGEPGQNVCHAMLLGSDANYLRLVQGREPFGSLSPRETSACRAKCVCVGGKSMPLQSFCLVVCGTSACSMNSPLATASRMDSSDTKW